MDDVAAILQNADVRGDTHWSALWTHDYWYVCWFVPPSAVRWKLVYTAGGTVAW